MAFRYQDASLENRHAPDGYRLQASDTSYAVERVLIDRWRAMSAAEKAAQVTATFRALHDLAACGVKMRHPHADEREIWLRAAELRLGPTLMADVYDWPPRTTPV